jgi:PAS domain S-box-containing protein
MRLSDLRVSGRRTHPHPVAHALRITGIYLVVGTLWIVFSDLIVNTMIADSQQIARLQSVKGVVYVAVTALVVYLLLHRAFRRLHDTNRELEQSRELHRESADYLRAVFEAAPLAILDLDTEGRVRHLWNPAAAELFGWDRHEIIGQKAPFVPEGRMEEFEELLSEVIAGRPLRGTQVPRARRDGSIVYVEISAVPLYHRDGEVSGAMSIVSDVTDKRRRARELKDALEEKEVLLSEVHHRVKNNLAVITGLIRLQLHELKEDDASLLALSKTRDRMEVMGLIHNMLYHEQNLSRVDVATVLRSVVSQLQDQYDAFRSVDVRLDLEQVPVEIGTALPLGLIANEAVTNALAHAFPERGASKLSVRLKPRAGAEPGYSLTIEDNGIGLPTGFDVNRQNSLGFRMMAALSQQLNAELSVDGERGTRVEVRFPV